MSRPHLTVRPRGYDPDHPYPGLLITLEGIDGSGKSTAMEAVREAYWHPITTREPADDSPIRESLQTDAETPLRDFYLFMADRAEHLSETVVPALERGCLVVSDRYADSTRAYQQHALKQHDAIASHGPARFVESTMEPWVIPPDLTIYLRCDVDTALDRCDRAETYENREMLRRAAGSYDAISEIYDRFVTVETDGLDAEEVQAAVIDEIDALIDRQAPSWRAP